MRDPPRNTQMVFAVLARAKTEYEAYCTHDR